MIVKARTLSYGGRRLQAGDKFQARGNGDAKLLMALGYAEIETAAVPVAPVIEEVKPKRAYHRRVIEAEPPVAPAEPPAWTPTEPGALVADDPFADKPKRAYKRRDLTAE